MKKLKIPRCISLLLVIIILTSVISPYYVQAAGLETPKISNPDDGESYAKEDMKVNWQDCDNADYYTVSLRDLTQDTLLIDMVRTTSSNYTIRANNFTPNHQYRVAVGSFGSDSQMWDEVEFSIKNPEVETPEISNPNEGNTYEAIDMKVNWQNCDNKEYYMVSLRDTTDDKLLIDKERISSSNYTIRANYFIPGHQYRVAVGAVGFGLEMWNEVQFSILAPIQKYKLSGYITDSNTGAALSGVTVNLNRSSNWNTTTNSSGYYEFNNVEASTHTVYASKSGYEGYQQNVDVYSNTTKNISITPSMQKYKLSGYISDSNTGNRLSGIAVNLNGSGNWNTTTDSNGYYEFNNVVASTHTIYASKTGYTNYQQNVDVYSNTTKNISMTPSVQKYKLSGYITDSKTGSALSGATVNLNGSSNWNVTTNYNGYYEFSNVEASTHTIYASKTGYTNYQQNTDVYSNTTKNISMTPSVQKYKLSGYITDNKTGSALSSVTVNLDGSSNWNTTTNSSGYYEFNNVEASTHTIYTSKTGYTNYQQNVDVYSNTTKNISMTSSVQKYKLSGYITDSKTGSALSGVTVNLNGSSNWNVTTNSSGYYEFNNVEACTHTIYVSKTGYTNYQQNVDVYSNTTKNISMTQSVQKYKLSGYITDSKTGSALSGVTVNLDGSSNWNATTNSSGYYEFNNVEANTHTIYTSKPGYTNYQQNVDVYSNAAKNISMTPSVQKYKLSGYITDNKTGSALSGVTVNLDGSSNWNITTNSNGYYEFNNVEASTHTIYTSKTGYANYQQNVDVFSNTTKNISMTLSVQKYKLSGYITDSKTGSALSGVTVNLNGSSNLVASTNSSGYYEFSSVESGIVYNLTTSVTGYNEYKQSIIVNNNYALSFKLTKIIISTFAIEGRVLYPNGEPMEGATVLLNEGGKWQKTTNSNGNYKFEGVAASPHLLTVRYGKYKEYSKYVTVYDRDLKVDDISLQGYTISGYIYYPNGKVPMVGAKIVLNHESDTRWHAYTNGEGYFEIKDALPGPHSITVSFNGYGDYEDNITLVDRDAPLGGIWLHGYSISGIVSDGSNPVKSADVYLNNVGDLKWHTTTDVSGYYAFNNVVSGTSHKIYVQKRGYLPSLASLDVPVNENNVYDQNVVIMPIRVSINGNYVVYNSSSGYPFISNEGRTLVPLRATLEAFGANVTWDSSKKMAYGIKGSTSIGVPLNKNYIIVNGVKVDNDAKAVSIGGKTYCPIRKILEEFGATVNWDDQNKSVLVSINNNIALISINNFRNIKVEWNKNKILNYNNESKDLALLSLMLADNSYGYDLDVYNTLGFSNVNIYEQKGNASGLVFNNEKYDLKTIIATKKISNWNDNQSMNLVSITFRGTKSLKDWAIDLTTDKTFEFKPIAFSKSIFESYNGFKDFLNFNIWLVPAPVKANMSVSSHEGFLNASQYFLNEQSKEILVNIDNSTHTLYDAISNPELNKRCIFWLNGHSLGGAVAAQTHALMRSYYKVPENIFTYTFNSPPTSNEDVINNNSIYCKNIYQFVNTNDIVAYGVKVMTGYGHLGNVYYDKITDNYTSTTKYNSDLDFTQTSVTFGTKTVYLSDKNQYLKIFVDNDLNIDITLDNYQITADKNANIKIYNKSVQGLEYYIFDNSSLYAWSKFAIDTSNDKDKIKGATDDIFSAILLNHGTENAVLLIDKHFEK